MKRSRTRRIDGIARAPAHYPDSQAGPICPFDTGQTGPPEIRTYLILWHWWCGVDREAAPIRSKQHD
ncbi:MAG: hypothetical protein IH899_05210 [Planctomycetes bacterium]|nr:hypothetical protein [Planctomycetota bacterium]